MTIREQLEAVSYSYNNLKDIPFDADTKFVILEGAVNLMESHERITCKKQRLQIAIAKLETDILNIPLVCDEVAK